MPYISIKTTPDINKSNTEQFAKELTENLSGILSKPSSTIMMDFLPCDALFMDGEAMAKGAVVQIMTFGETANDVKSKANDYLCDFLESKMKIPKDKVYVIFSDKKEWGYKGSFISR